MQAATAWAISLLVGAASIGATLILSEPTDNDTTGEAGAQIEWINHAIALDPGASRITVTQDAPGPISLQVSAVQSGEEAACVLAVANGLRDAGWAPEQNDHVHLAGLDSDIPEPGASILRSVDADLELRTETHAQAIVIATGADPVLVITAHRDAEIQIDYGGTALCTNRLSDADHATAGWTTLGESRTVAAQWFMPHDSFIMFGSWSMNGEVQFHDADGAWPMQTGEAKRYDHLVHGTDGEQARLVAEGTTDEPFIVIRASIPASWPAL